MYQLLNFLKGEKKEVTSLSPKANKQEIADLVARIHRDFMTKGDALYVKTKADLEKRTELVKRIGDTGTRLDTMGFKKAKPVKEIVQLRKEIEHLNKTYEFISYYNEIYPQYKIITREDILNVCKKYNLVFGEVKDYVGTVPTNNIEDMENFKVKNKDRMVLVTGPNSFRRIMKKEEYKAVYEARTNFKCYKAPLMIAGPIGDFDMSQKMVNENLEVVNKPKPRPIPDPVVFYPLENNYFMIITAWGAEADDEVIKNGSNI